MQRRVFLAGAAAGIGVAALRRWPISGLNTDCRFAPTHAVIPVVGDGKWIWTEPPSGQTGYLEPRSFQLKIGIELTGEGDATNIRASTPVPLEHPEQSVDDVRLEADGCQARLQQVGEGAAQILLAASQIARGQIIRAIAHYQLTLKKQYLGHAADHFPAEQPEPPPAIRKLYLQESPGIQTRSPEVQKLLARLLRYDQPHPWDLSRRFTDWIGENIEPKRGTFIGVVNALKRGHGDCEEMAGIMVALCRAAEIPARLVWIPNHNWAEMYLADHDGEGHWIPVHTACYSWFGWTGVHELVIQKGDRVFPPHEERAQRLLGDWMQWMGKRPTSRYIAELTPLPPKAADASSSSGSDPGPGARTKIGSGEWKLTGAHPMDRYMRNG
jgi:hypothetical protein